MRPLVTLLVAISSLLFIVGVAAASKDQLELSTLEQAIAIWDANDVQSDPSSAAAAHGSEDLARYAQLEHSNLHAALAVEKPSDAPLPLAITPFSSAE